MGHEVPKHRLHKRGLDVVPGHTRVLFQAVSEEVLRGCICVKLNIVRAQFTSESAAILKVFDNLGNRGTNGGNFSRSMLGYGGRSICIALRRAGLSRHGSRLAQRARSSRSSSSSSSRCRSVRGGLLRNVERSSGLELVRGCRPRRLSSLGNCGDRIMLAPASKCHLLWVSGSILITGSSAGRTSIGTHSKGRVGVLKIRQACGNPTDRGKTRGTREARQILHLDATCRRSHTPHDRANAKFGMNEGGKSASFEAL